MNKNGFFPLKKKSADENFKYYCLSRGQHTTNLVSMLRNHGYLQHVDTKTITVRSTPFLKNYKQLIAELEKAGISKQAYNKIEISAPKIEIDSSFSKVDLENHIAHGHEDMSFDDDKLGCFICQDSFRNKTDLNNHRNGHKALSIEYDESDL